MSPDADVVVVGSGVAGLTVALGMARTRRVVLVTGSELGAGSTRWAQGGLAAAVAAGDSVAWHAADTAAAGGGLCARAAVDRLVEEAPLRVAELVSAGAVFDRDACGRLAVGREGGHTRHRVVHAGGDATGAEVSRALVAALRDTQVEIVEHATVTDVLLASGAGSPAAAGVRVRGDAATGELSARAVVLATGGIGALYAGTTNPPEVVGSGWGLALRAGATLTDVEFVQFHPTALRLDAGGQLPLVTEALRGQGAVLVDGDGRRLMLGAHPLADLAPRDVVARRLHQALATDRGRGVFLDATGLGRERLRRGFPTVCAVCAAAGIDPASVPIPVVPAQHFACGGVRTDRWGGTDVPGLFAAGEVAATGVHGANRLASNSLIEGLVYGSRVAVRLVLDLPAAQVASAPRVDRPAAAPGGVAPSVRTTMSAAAGIVRCETELAQAEGILAAVPGSDPVLAARALVAAARHRRESRGCHWRADFPSSSDAWRRHLPVRLDASGDLLVEADPPGVRSA